MSALGSNDLVPVTDGAPFDPDAVDPVEVEGLMLVLKAEGLEIVDQPSFELAATLRRLVKDLIALIEGDYKPMKQAQDAAKRVILEQERARLQAPKQALEIVNRKLVAYETVQRRNKMIAEIRAAEESERTATPVPAVAVPTAKAEGLTFSTHWRAEVTDRMELIKGVAGGFGSAMLLEPNQGMLNELVRSSKGTMVIPGVRAVEDSRTRG